MLIIRNGYYHSNFSDYEISWELTQNGKMIQSGVIDTLTISPQSWARIILPVHQPELSPGNEYWLNLSVNMKKGGLL